MDPLHFRRLPGRHRHQDAAGRGPGAQPRRQPATALPAPPAAGHRQLHGERFFVRLPDPATGPPAALDHAPVSGPGADRGRRPDLRGRLGAGDLRHHPGPVHRLHVEHLRGARPARALLRAGRDDPPLPLPEIRAGPGARVRRRQDLPGQHHRQDSARVLAVGTSWPVRRRRALQPVADRQASGRTARSRAELRRRGR